MGRFIQSDAAAVLIVALGLFNLGLFAYALWEATR